jgi:hypothetical protein
MSRARTPVDRLLTRQRAQRSVRVTQIRSLISWCQILPDATVGYWRDEQLVHEVRRLVRLVKSFGWLER